METMTWTFRKDPALDEERFSYIEEWPAGEWDNEPDKMQWEDPATKLPCLVVRNHMGAWCGYVGLPVGHPWRGMEYDAIPADVHGGLTFGPHPCMEDKTTICHVVDTPEEDDVHWIGFDCHHLMDTSPGMMASHAILNKQVIARGEEPLADIWGENDDDDCIYGRRSYKPISYARAEVTTLASQVHAAR